MKDIYSMKESIYTKAKESEYIGKANSRKPIAVVLIVSIVLIVLLNLVNTLIFY